MDVVVVEALEAVARASGADRGYLVLVGDDDTFELTHEWLASGIVADRPALARTAWTEFECAYGAARRGEVFAAHDVGSLPDEADAERRSFGSLGVRAVLQVPITVTGEGIGLIGVNHREPVDEWSPDLIDTMRRVGNVTAGVVLRQRTAERLRRQRGVAAANRQRDDLFAQVSHELRNPLHAILGYAELLALETTSSQNREAVDQIVRNGRHLLALIEELLANDAAEPAAAAVRPEIDAAVASIGDVAAVRRISITATARTHSSSIPIPPGRLRQVVYCVLTGAVHAAEDGAGVVVDCPVPGTIRVRVDRSRPSSTPVNPLARALIEGYGHLDARQLDGAAEIDLTFGSGGVLAAGADVPPDQGANP